MTVESYKQLINTLFDMYCERDYPPEIRVGINSTIRYFSDALHTSPAKIDGMITNSICAVELYSFEQGFHACPELISLPATFS